ncbi:MAG: isoprenylcysteine carboxylmethyltransferase family protein [Bacteroidetes bacterium]|nr:isoprenylcysteine carboxylmethyltransferase family protein [Bacteroidota bacterium]
MEKTKKKSKWMNLAWFPYFLILFEMLYMATPFAVYFYSVYQFPLKFLNENALTAGLIQTVFPHFVETNSQIIHWTVDSGWILMVIGLCAFSVGFFQIYYAKFRKKGAVTGGIYSLIRHPQYAAWILFGLGMALIWSRLIVWIMYVSMIFIYYFLARAEEKECMEKFPETYPAYFKKTGRFHPFFRSGSGFRIPFPKSPAFYTASVFMIYVISITLTILSARVLREYSIPCMSTAAGEGYMAVSLNYIPPEITQKTVDILLADQRVKARMDSLFTGGDAKIMYVMPQTWKVSELGMTTGFNEGDDPAARTVSHGNPEDVNPLKKRVLVSKAYLTEESDSSDILKNLKQQKPKLYVDIDLETGTVTSISLPPEEGIYSDIPVPVF